MRLVVVGGVTGGMGCAARYRRLDEEAEIIVLERGQYVSFANCALPYHVGGQVPRAAQLIVQTPETLRESLNLDIRLGHEAIAIDAAARSLSVRTEDGIEQLEYDELVLSPGAQAIIPPIDGVDSPRVTTLRTVDDAVNLADTVAGGAQRALIIGAGFIGLEAAESLAVRGLDVTIVELAPHILPPAEAEIAGLIRAELEGAGLHIYEGTSADAIRDGENAATVTLSNGIEIEADIILLSAGVRPATAFFEEAGGQTERGAILTDEHGRTNLEHVWALGDASAQVDAVTGEKHPVALAGPAARAGRYIADAIYNIETARPIPPALGTAIVSVGTQAAGMTGANSRSLEKAGIEYHTIHLHPNQHVAWYPGPEEMHLLVHFAKDDGRILGAQAVGRDGIDKRIDVFASAIRAGKSISDMIDLDLAYSPQFGMPKDPVIMAGLIGDNVLAGTLKLWHAEELADIAASHLLVDVRRADEFEAGHVRGAINVPHTDIRERLDSVATAAAGRPIALICHSGLRSYIAHRVLAAAGLESSSLDGGMVSLMQIHPEGLTEYLEGPQA